jgi:hypothetical protein
MFTGVFKHFFELFYLTAQNRKKFIAMRMIPPIGTLCYGIGESKTILYHLQILLFPPRRAISFQKISVQR